MIETEDAILRIVPNEELSNGCAYCYLGWAEGPGLIYKCECNETEGPYTYNVG
jgi:hypothetical protein